MAARRYVWVKVSEVVGWEPAMVDHTGKYWPMSEDGWSFEKDMLQIGTDIPVPQERAAE